MKHLSLQDIEGLLSGAAAGPWSIRAKDGVKDASNEVVAQCYGWCGKSNCNATNTTEAERNAELIAAAPNLARQLIKTMQENEILRAHLGTTDNMLAEFSRRIKMRRGAMSSEQTSETKDQYNDG